MFWSEEIKTQVPQQQAQQQLEATTTPCISRWKCVFILCWSLNLLLPKGKSTLEKKDINVGVKGWGNLWKAASIYLKGWKQHGHPQQLQLWGVKWLYLQAPMCIPKHTELWYSLPSQITLISPHGVKCLCWSYFCFPQQDKRMLKVQTIMHQVGERESHPGCRKWLCPV
jgi:hypothetical protein